MVLLNHIKRAPTGLPPVHHHNRALATRKFNGTKGGETWVKFDNDFLLDMPSLRTGWVCYLPGVGRQVTVELVSSEIEVDQPNDKASPIGLVTIASETMMAELEIADTLLRDAFQTLYDAYLAAPQSKKNLIPIVTFHGGLHPRFTISEWAPRDDDFWGAIDSY